MNLQEIRTNVIKHSGRYDLIGQDGSDPDYTADNGIDHFINMGQRELERRMSHGQMLERYANEVAVGGYQFAVPNLRTPMQVWASDGATRWELIYKDSRWLRNNYSKPYELLDTGTPLYWTRSRSRLNDFSALTGNILSEPVEYETSDFPLDYTDGSNRDKWIAAPSAQWEWSSGSGAGFTSASSASLQIGYTGTRTGAVSVTTTGGGCALALGLIDDAGAITSVATASGSGAGTVTATPSSGATWNLIAILPEDSTTGYVTDVDGPGLSSSLEDIADTTTSFTPSILFMPPTDKAVTIQVLGTFDTPAMTNNDDSTWLTERFPQESIWAALYCLEVSYRNTQGANDWNTALERSLKYIHDDEAEYLSVDFTELEG